MSARIYRLSHMHQRIDAALRSEITRRMPDQLTVMSLKKQKLRIKDLLHQSTARLTSKFAQEPQQG